MAFAQGKHSYGVCDRCGFRVRYTKMQMEWTGFKVCPECYEPKHPQLEPPHKVSDPEGLRQARPEVPLPQTQLGVVFAFGPSNTTVSGVNVGGQPLSTLLDPIGSKFEGVSGESALGEITVVIT
jgi:hypothetical protein